MKFALEVYDQHNGAMVYFDNQINTEEEAKQKAEFWLKDGEIRWSNRYGLVGYSQRYHFVVREVKPRFELVNQPWQV